MVNNQLSTEYIKIVDKKDILNMLKAIKLRIYPNINQEIYINKLLGCYRFTYNKSLDFAIQYYKINNKSVNLSILGEFLFHKLLKNEEYSFLNEHNTKILNQTLINLLNSYKRFFINGNGFPKFKSKKIINKVLIFL